MRIGVVDHGDKAALLIATLQAAGHEIAGAWMQRIAGGWRFHGFNFDVLLVDIEHPTDNPAKYAGIKFAASLGIPIVMYPHGANVILDYDGIRRLDPRVGMVLVHGEGHREVYRRIGLPARTEVVGWTYSEAVPPDLGPSAGGGQRVLFAPIHPWADGKTILPVHGNANRQGYEALLSLDECQRTVRLFGEDVPNGIFHNERRDDITYQQAELTTASALEQIDTHDLIISAGTFAHLALARGKRVIMIGSDIPAMSDDGSKVAAHWDDYKDFIRYPVDIADGPVEDLIGKTDGRDVAEWKHLFVGDDFDPDRFLNLIEGMRPNRETRRRLARAR